MKPVDIELLALGVKYVKDSVIIGVSFRLDGKRCGVITRCSLDSFVMQVDPFLHPSTAQSLSRHMVVLIKSFLAKKEMVLSDESHILQEIIRATMLITVDFQSYNFCTQEVNLRPLPIVTAGPITEEQKKIALQNEELFRKWEEEFDLWLEEEEKLHREMSLALEEPARRAMELDNERWEKEKDRYADEAARTARALFVRNIKKMKK